MSRTRHWSLSTFIVAGFQHIVRKYLWRMDIDASAMIEPTAYIDRTWPKGIHIGPRCYVGIDAVILTHDMVRGLYLDTYVGAGTVVGARSVIMPGLKIGENCQIAPGAVVIKDMPAKSVAVGNPADISAKMAAVQNPTG